MAKMQCIVVTPEITLRDADADFVAVPLYDGEMGIGQNHSPMLGRTGNGEMRITNEGQAEDLKAARLSAKLGRTVDTLVAIGTALVLWYGALLVLRGSMTPGDLVVFLTYLRRAFKPARDFAKYTARLAKASAAGERVLGLLEEIPEIRDLPHARPAGPLAGRLSFENVAFEYESGHPVLCDVDFEVETGQL